MSKELDILDDLDDLFEEADKIEETIIEVKETLETEVIPDVEVEPIQIDVMTDDNIEKAQKSNTQSSNVIHKYAKLADAFEIKVDSMSEDIEDILDTTKDELVAYHKTNELTEDVKDSAFNIDLLTSDFGTMRKTILDTLKDGRLVQQKYTDEILLSSVADISPQILLGFSELMKAVAKQVELLSKIYKDVAETQVKLKSYMKKEQMIADANGEGSDGTTNIQNNYIMTTQELISKFIPES